MSMSNVVDKRWRFIITASCVIVMFSLRQATRRELLRQDLS